MYILHENDAMKHVTRTSMNYMNFPGVVALVLTKAALLLKLAKIALGGERCLGEHALQPLPQYGTYGIFSDNNRTSYTTQETTSL